MLPPGRERCQRPKEGTFHLTWGGALLGSNLRVDISAEIDRPLDVWGSLPGEGIQIEGHAVVQELQSHRRACAGEDLVRGVVLMLVGVANKP
jgi:hypothetical protein